MSPYYQRPEGGWRAHFQGIKTNSPADAIEATKSPYAQNIRGTKSQTVQTRPGYVNLFSTETSPITDVNSYATLETDGRPRFLVRNELNHIYLDTGAQVGSLAGSSLGACMIPYRPNQSPQSWMYVAARNDYKKYSAPDAANNVIEYDVGIEEQQRAPDACAESFSIYEFLNAAADWTNSGTAGTTSDVDRIMTDTIGAFIEDPASGVDKRYSIEVSTTTQYQIGMEIVVDKLGGDYHTVIQDILPPINDGTALTIESIYYYPGTNRCVIVPNQLPSNATTPYFIGNNPAAASVYSDAVLAALRRSAIVQLDNGGTQEKVFVLSATTGPTGTICFEVETADTTTFHVGDSITGIPVIVCTGVNGAASGDTIDAAAIASTFTGAGTGNLDQALSTSPFIQLLDPGNNTPQQDDYVLMGINISDLSKLTQGTIIFNTDPSVDYQTNGFYTQFSTNDLIAHPPAQTQVTQVLQTVTFYDPIFGNVETQQLVNVTSLTPLPANQWSTIIFPIRGLSRLGNDLTKTLANCNGIRISLQCTDDVDVEISGFIIGGGGQPDVANNLPPYFYAVVGRDPLTSVQSNPSPITRYGVSPRRQPVIVSMQDTNTNPAMKMWDVYRYGGTLTSWRRLGSTPNTGGLDKFVDNYFDAEVNAGSAMEFDNYQPWPSIDVPFNATAGAVNIINTVIELHGSVILLIYHAGVAFTNPAPANILSWLPGTLLLIEGQSAYTLQARPTLVTLPSPPNPFYFAYEFRIVENAGAGTPTTLDVLEPNVANQHLPYLWGPDAQGVIFAAGDPLRPGSVYYCKKFTPDSAPDTNNQELCAPSEPILGGEIIDGISMVSSSLRWWALYPNYDSTTGAQYQAVERPVGRALLASKASCTDGRNIYFWTKDGIAYTSGGGYASLTDADLYNLFPHDGVNTPQNYQYGTFTLFVPDYRYAAYFRLAYCNGYLYADYRDANGFTRTLVCDIRDLTNPAWCVDGYIDQVTVHWAVAQQESTLATTTARYPLLVLGDAAGNMHSQSLNTNDGTEPIPCVFGTFEYNGGDIRSDQLFDDFYLDILSPAIVQAVALMDGIAVIAPKAFPAIASRHEVNLPVGLELKYCGVLLAWTDNFNKSPLPTIVYAWQPMYQGVPVSVILWKLQATAFGMQGYGHLRQWNFAYRSTSSVVITVAIGGDGTAPQNVVLPSTGGAVRKTMFPFTFNKWLLCTIQAQTTDGSMWTPYLSESELFVGAWGRTDQYLLVHDIEAPMGLRS